MKPEQFDTIRSTDEFAGTGAFRAHGKLELRVEGSVIHASAYGPFNTEFVMALARTLDEVRRSASLTRPYADIVEFHGSLLASQEMLGKLSEMMSRVTGDDVPTALAFVVAPEVEGRDLMLPLFERIIKHQHQRNYRAFDNMPGAQAWVNECLAKAAGG